MDGATVALAAVGAYMAHNITVTSIQMLRGAAPTEALLTVVERVAAGAAARPTGKAAAAAATTAKGAGKKLQ